MMKSEVFLIVRMFVNKISALRGYFQTFFWYINFSSAEKGLLEMISHDVITHLGFFIIYVCFPCSVGDFAVQSDSGLCLLKLL